MSAQPIPALQDTSTNVADEEKRKKEQFRLFVRNLVVMIACGVVMSWWLVEYTDFFPAVGGFFGLAGIFAWVAFLSGLVREERKTELQAAFETRVLAHAHTTAYTLMLFILFACWTLVHGTLVVMAPDDGTKRVLEITSGEETIDTIEVPSGATVKELIFTGGTRQLVLKTAGLPELPVTLGSLLRETVVLPQSFQRQPVLFAIGLSADDRTSLGSEPSVVAHILRGKGPWTKHDELPPGTYAGESVWIGASADTELPSRLRARLPDEQPKALGASNPLRIGDRIRVCVMNSEGGEVAFAEARILEDKQRIFPQELQLTTITDPEKRCTP